VRNVILKLLMAAMLFVSMEGVADAADEQSFHQAHHAHMDDAGAHWFPDSESGGHDGDACDHFCHAHVVGLTSQVALANPPQLPNFVPVLATRNLTHSPPPPTPPPDA
jgi:hypothetical protein